MRVLVTGSSGFVGRALCSALAARGDTVLAVSRHGPLTWENLDDAGAVDAIVHLAGENVAQRWTAAAKKKIVSSRVDTLARLRGVGARVLVSASAIGYYGGRGDELLAESEAPGRDFLADTCVAWEKAALSLGVPRTVILRFGMVLGKGGGALEKMLPAFRHGLGGRIGSGEQWVSWIQLDDLVALLLRALDDPQMKGVYNAVAPEPVRNAEFATDLASVLGTHARFPVPAFALRLALGDMAGMLLTGQRVSAGRLEAAGFSWRYPKVIEALRASV